MKAKRFALICLVLLFCLFSLSTAAEPVNLYSYAYTRLGAAAVPNPIEGCLDFILDNTSGTAEEYTDFFAVASPAIVAGERYTVSYSIETLLISGSAEVSISSEAALTDMGTFQLGNEKVRHYISSTGVLENSFTVTAQANSAAVANMLRSYIYVPAGSAFAAKIRIHVVPYTDYADACQIKAAVGGQTVLPYRDAAGTYMLLPACADYKALPLFGELTLIGANGASVTLTETAVPVNLEALGGVAMLPGEQYTFATQTAGGAAGESVTFMKADNLSTLFINADISLGELNLTKDNKGSGTLVLLDAAGAQVNADTVLKRIKGRGNSTWNYSGEKKPYNIKLDAKAELIPGAGKAKDWCLLSDNCSTDPIGPGSAVVNAAAFDMFEALGGNTPLKYQFINFYYNGEYRGVYLLTEKVEIGSSRVDITETEYLYEDEDNRTLVISQYGVPEKPEHWKELDTSGAIYLGSEDSAIAAGIAAYQYCPGSQIDGQSGGILLELDRGFYDEASWFLTSHGIPYILKEPEFATREQVQKIAIYVQQYEDALYSPTGYNSLGKYYTEYIDLDSLVRKVVLDMATAQLDAFGGSCYFNVDVDAAGNYGKLLSGPAWDYDASDYSSWTTFYNTNKTKQLLKEMFRHGDFAARFSEVSYNELRTIWLDEEVRIRGYVDMIDSSYKMNTVLWNSDGSNPKSSNFAELLRLFPQRISVYYNSLFDTAKLLGVTAAAGPGTLVASPRGTYTALQWYKLGADGSLQPIIGATAQSYTPTENGTYFCGATGTVEVKLEVTEMISNPVAFHDALPVEASIELEGSTLHFTLGTAASVGVSHVACYDADGKMLLIISERFTGSLTKTISVGPGVTFKAYILGENGVPLCADLLVTPTA